MAKVFLSYRRDDSAGYAGRLYDRLRNHFGKQQVFMDVSAIEVGEDFAHVIEEKVGSCDVFIALIGKQWFSSTDNEGRRRLENAEDFVRLEIAAALDRNILVIPTLVGGAIMPSMQELPPVLKGLSRRQALEIGDTRFHEDVNQLIKHLEETISGLKAEETLWPPPVLRNLYRKKRHWPLGVGGAVAVLIAGYMLLPRGRTPLDESPAIEDEVKIVEESGPPADTSPAGPVEQQIGQSSKDSTAPRDSQPQEFNRKDPQRPASKPASAKVAPRAPPSRPENSGASNVVQQKESGAGPSEKPERPQNTLLQKSSPPLPLESSLRKDPNQSYRQPPAKEIKPAMMADPKGDSPAPNRYQEPKRRNDIEAPANRGEQDQIQSGEDTEQAPPLAEKAEADYVAIQRLAIQRLLKSFTEAYERRDANAVLALWPTLSSDRFKSISTSFEQARSISFDLQPVSYPRVEQDQVKLTCKSSMQTVSKRGKRMEPVEDEVTIELHKREGSWVIENMIFKSPDC